MTFDFTTATIIIDTREQLPLTIRGCLTRVATLPTGDYGLEGLSGEKYEDETEEGEAFEATAPKLVVWERKSLSDLIGSLMSGRERFLREIERMREFSYAVLMIEANEDMIRMGQFTSGANPLSVLGSLERIRQLGIHITFCQDRAGMVEFLERSARLLLSARHKSLAVGRKKAGGAEPEDAGNE